MQIRRRLESGGFKFFVVVLQPDGSFASVPAWMTEPAASRFEIGDEPRFPLRHPRSPVHNARRLALDGPSMRDPKMSRSETAGLVAEMTDATATKSAKTVKK
jgi:hypothetical protein